MILRKDLVSMIKFHISSEETTDPVIKAITDEDIETLLKAKSSQLGYAYPNIPIQDESLVLCLVRKDIYWKMATVSAPLYKLNLDDLTVAKEVRFDHYFKLVQEAEKEFTSLSNDPNRVTVQQAEALVKRVYNLNKYYNNYTIPTPILMVDNVTESSIELSMDYRDTKLNDYLKTNIYYSSLPIMDKYDDNKISEEAQCITLNNHRQKYVRISNVDTTQTVYVLMEVILKSTFKGYSSELEVMLNV